MNELIVRRVRNGWYVRETDVDDDAGYRPMECVFEIPESYSDDRLKECNSFKDLLYFMLNELGPIYSDHELYNIDISITNEDPE